MAAPALAAPPAFNSTGDRVLSVWNQGVTVDWTKITFSGPDGTFTATASNPGFFGVNQVGILSRVVYRGETVTRTALAGAATNGAAEQSAPASTLVINGSTAYDPHSLQWTLPDGPLEYTLQNAPLDFTLPHDPLEWTA